MFMAELNVEKILNLTTLLYLQMATGARHYNFSARMWLMQCPHRFSDKKIKMIHDGIFQ